MKNGLAAGVDVKTYESAAAAIAKWGGIYVKLFPPGTETGNNTKAKKEIWSDRAGFEKAGADMVAAATKLAEAAKSGDKASFTTAFQGLGQSCGGCHRNYRERQ
jgi:cytochrome c556